MYDAAGERFGRYRLVEKLGEGGMAVVWRAVLDGPEGFARELVIKRIHRRWAGDDRLRRLLFSEACIAARLRHPAIVQVYELGQIAGEPYLAMELVDGLDLARLFRLCLQRELRLPAGLCCFVIREVAEALAHAHALCDEYGRPLGLVHRDVTPSNVMVTPLGTVKLLDFGIAKAAAWLRSTETATEEGALRGKLAYLSPEQANGRDVDGRSDLFALGIVFHELLTMQRLFVGATPFEMLARIRAADVPRPSSLVPRVPRAVDTIVMRLLEGAPERRFQSADELVEALAPLVRRLDGNRETLRGFMSGLLAARVPEQATSPAWDREDRPQLGRNVRLALLAAASTLLLSGAPPPAEPRHTAEPRHMIVPPPARIVPPPHAWLGIAGPDGAIAIVDGQTQGTLPLVLRLPRRPGARRIEVTLPGSAPFIAEVPADRDAALVARLR